MGTKLLSQLDELRHRRQQRQSAGEETKKKMKMNDEDEDEKNDGDGDCDDSYCDKQRNQDTARGKSSTSNSSILVPLQQPQACSSLSSSLRSSDLPPSEGFAAKTILFLRNITIGDKNNTKRRKTVSFADHITMHEILPYNNE